MDLQNVYVPSWTSQVAVSELPAASWQSYVNAINSYSSTIEETNAKICCMINDIDLKIRGFREQNFLVTDTDMIDLTMSKIDLESEMEAAEHYKQAAEKALQSFQESINSYIMQEGIIRVGATVLMEAFNAVNGHGRPGTGYELVQSASVGQALMSGSRIAQEFVAILRQFRGLQARCSEVKCQFNITTTKIEELKIKVKRRVNDKIALLKPAV